jgi:hypothetical protein
MPNTRVEIVSDDKEYYLQDAPAQSVRAYYTPGKITPATINRVDTLAENWPREFPVKVGVPAIDNAGGADHVRVFMTGRDIVCDVTIAPPVVTGSTVVSCVDTAHGINGSHTLTKTTTQNDNGVQEHLTGWNGLTS